MRATEIRTLYDVRVLEVQKKVVHVSDKVYIKDDEHEQLVKTVQQVT